ncbi:histone-lysine N-methyltransferase Suv4-20-like [Sergentomyia squamirostris]
MSGEVKMRMAADNSPRMENMLMVLVLLSDRLKGTGRGWLMESEKLFIGVGGAATAISREDGEEGHQHHHHHHHHHHHRGGHQNHGGKVPFNGYNSDEYLDRLEPNGNIPADKSDLRFGKCKYSTP